MINGIGMIRLINNFRRRAACGSAAFSSSIMRIMPIPLIMFFLLKVITFWSMSYAKLTATEAIIESKPRF